MKKIKVIEQLTLFTNMNSTTKRLPRAMELAKISRSIIAF